MNPHDPSAGPAGHGRRPAAPASAEAPETGSHLDAFVRWLGAGSPAGASPAPGPGAADGPPPRDRLGEFRLVREVGRGGMGVVYEAEQVALRRRVALKVLPDGLSLDPRRRRRFAVEARAAARLDHPHIVPVFGFGYDGGVPYYAMRFVAGRSLAELIDDRRGRPLPPGEAAAEAARLGAQAADALAHAHAVGVTHRDVKPSNLLVEPGGHLWVADFGLARVAHDESDLTGTGDLVGTLRYMAPELLSASPARPGPRTDVYALGVTLYELLTLRPAFAGSGRPGLIHRILHEEPPAPSRVAAGVPRDLETVVLQAMAKDPDARFATAADLAADLRRFLDGVPVRARRPSPSERLAAWGRRHRRSLAAAAVLGALLAGGASLLVRARQEADEAVASHRLALEASARERASYNRDRLSERLAVEEALAAMDQIAGPAAESARRGSAADTSTLRRALALYDRIAGMFATDRAMREVAAKSYRRAGRTRLALREAGWHRDFDRAVGLYQAIAAEHPNYVWIRTDLLGTLRDTASALAARGEVPAASAARREALEVAAGLVDDPEASARCFRPGLTEPFRSLAAELSQPGTPPAEVALAVRLARRAAEWEPESAASWSTLAAALHRAGDRDAAASALEKSRSLPKGPVAHRYPVLVPD